MASPRGLLFLAILLSLAPQAAGFWPGMTSGVLAVDQGSSILLSWAPVSGATAYNLYGQPNLAAQPILLGTTTSLSAELADIYSRYGVSAIVDGQEGTIRYAEPYCLDIRTDPPRVGIYECGRSLFQTRPLP